MWRAHRRRDDQTKGAANLLRKEFLAQVNKGREEKDELVTLLPFAPTAPEQNPVDDIWLAGKNQLRRQLAKNKAFAQVKESFDSFLKTFLLKSIKFQWCAP
jgi:putative transposase